MPIANSRLERLQIRKLLQCVNNKDVDQIKKLIEHGVPNLINYNDPDNGATAKNGKTSFLEACGTGSSISVTAALRAGADLNSCDKEKQSSAHEAAKNGHLKVLFVLSAFGFDFNVVSEIQLRTTVKGTIH
ncbi:uncharacterized protein DC041_0006710 [Schistosoma bovis]|uniref:Uncharacterized protein n=1 Tax=Schistosoma bovis TaxID=6184 RepID=A0A430QF42_SCHBO|nr:uncharacterized protein DC041_0006710 [Schistosoma bovis]